MTSNNSPNNNNMTLQLPQRPGEADCRDFLRTGRCKYGDSCKYHHPSNVMSGGGIKGPIDPNEPLFPIRPDEQVCQYYMKHGTCKFGQTCKFHHPIHFLKTTQMQCLPAGTSQQLISPSQQQTPSQQPQLTSTSIVNGTSNSHEGVVVTGINGSNGGIHNNSHNNNSSNNNGIHTVMSASDFFLPQRPGEQDCIYFLRNGRCKYGASCKYHHPRERGRSVSAGSIQEATRMLNFQVLPTHQFPHHNSSTKLFSIPSSQLNSSQQMQQKQQQQATHVLLSDGPITLMTVNPHSNYSNNNNNNMNNGNMNNGNNNMNSSSNSNIPFYGQETDPILPPDQHTPYPSMSSLENHQMPPNLKNDANDWSSRNNNNNNNNNTNNHNNRNVNNNLHRIPSYEDDNLSEMQHHFYHNTRRYPPPPNRTPNNYSMHSDEIRMRPPSHKNRLPMGSGIHKRWGSQMSLPSSNNMELNNNNNNVQELNNSSSVQHSSQATHNLSSSAPSHLGRNYLMEYGNRTLSHSQSFASDTTAAHQEKDQGRKMDDGLSMMTSALLTMLDTPDDKGKIIKEEYELSSATLQDMDRSAHSSSGNGIHNLDQPFSGGMQMNSPSHSATLDNSRPSHNNNNPIYSEQHHHQYNGIIRNNSNNSILYNDPHNNNIHNTFTNEDHKMYRPRSESLSTQRTDLRDLTPRDTGRWSPSWRHGYSNNSGHDLERNAHSVSALQNSQTHATPKIGLYLS